MNKRTKRASCEPINKPIKIRNLQIKPEFNLLPRIKVNLNPIVPKKKPYGNHSLAPNPIKMDLRSVQKLTSARSSLQNTKCNIKFLAISNKILFTPRHIKAKSLSKDVVQLNNYKKMSISTLYNNTGKIKKKNIPKPQSSIVNQGNLF